MANSGKPDVHTNEQQVLNVQQALDLALKLHTAGRLPEAENLYKQILKNSPNQPDALHLLGVIAHQVGKNDLAVDLISKSIIVKPDNADAHLSLGNVLSEVERTDEAIESFCKALAINPDSTNAHIKLGNLFNKLGQLDESVECYRKVLSIKPDYTEMHNNIATAYQSQRLMDEAVDEYRQALAINPEYVEAHLNLGNLFNMLGQLDEAMDCYRTILSIDPEHIEASANLATALNRQGQLDEAVELLHSVLVLEPENIKASDILISMLNIRTPKASSDEYVKANKALQKIEIENAGSTVVTDEAVQTLYEQCHNILAKHKVNDNTAFSQFWWGKNYDQGCKRHLKVFDKFNAIPEYCFGCFKVSVAPRTVMELFKLIWVFRYIKLPKDNTRKCHIELRPEIVGTYKGLIYCQGMDEAQKIMKIAKKAVSTNISKDIPVTIKRGCSEYPLAYPEFGNTGDDGTPMMVYREEWRENEDAIDKEQFEYKYPLPSDTRNHAGFTLYDALVMKKWIAYAATIEDLSYLEISGSPVKKLQAAEGRPPITSGTDK